MNHIPLTDRQGPPNLSGLRQFCGLLQRHKATNAQRNVSANVVNCSGAWSYSDSDSDTEYDAMQRSRRLNEPTHEAFALADASG